MFQNRPHARLQEDCQLMFFSSELPEQPSEVFTFYWNRRPEFCFCLSSESDHVCVFFAWAGHFLGVATLWIVQVTIEIYRFFTRMIHSKEEGEEVETTEQVKNVGKKISATTVRCGASLIFASIGAGIGATLFRPSAGQWIGMLIFTEWPLWFCV